MRERVKERLPEFTEEQKKDLKGSADFFGINHYATNLIQVSRLGGGYISFNLILVSRLGVYRRCVWGRLGVWAYTDVYQSI